LLDTWVDGRYWSWYSTITGGSRCLGI